MWAVESKFPAHNIASALPATCTAAKTLKVQFHAELNKSRITRGRDMAKIST